MPPRKKSNDTDMVKRATDIVTALATVVAAFSLVLAYWSYRDVERSARLQRTQTLLHEASKEYSDDGQRQWLFKFDGRWSRVIVPMSAADADSFFKLSAQSGETDDHKKWNAARRHLNRLEDLSFAYVHDLADNDLLVAATCLEIVRSNKYFEALIKRFTAGHPAHGWLVIPEAADMLEKEYGPECKNLRISRR